ncbi:MAG: hypothetical protein IPP83_10595 [Flavobacteriales bacterium]|nr:hypothetical protein [Flavobacteriales bacterium]
MTDRTKLTAIKSLHTAIWLFFNGVIFYMLYAVIMDRIDRWFWIALGLIGLEVLALLLFRWSCPLTVVARKYSASTKANFDIYLPHWLAKYNKEIYTVIMAVVLVGMAWRLAT